MEKNNIFTKPYDTVLFACSVLKRLGSGSVESFEQRLKSQKIQYFAQLFGVSPIYRFNLYLRGPYSPDLSHDLFLIKEKNIKIESNEFVVEDLENKFKKLKKFIANKNIRKLEIISTLHWLLKVAKIPQKEVIKRLVELKKATSEEVKYAFRTIKELS